jgi:exosortase K
MKKLNLSWIRLCYFALALCIGLGIKYFYSVANNEQLRFMLFPVHLFIELQTGYQGVFEADRGYFFSNLNICIDKSCAGLNFFAIAFLSCSFIVIQKTVKERQLPIYLFISLSVSFLVTVLANSSRIFLALLTLRSFPTLAAQSWFHEAQGVFVFISILLFFHIFVLYIMEFVQFQSSSK